MCVSFVFRCRHSLIEYLSLNKVCVRLCVDVHRCVDICVRYNRYFCFDSKERWRKIRERGKSEIDSKGQTDFSRTSDSLMNA